jgi:hypothetical protein
VPERLVHSTCLLEVLPCCRHVPRADATRTKPSQAWGFRTRPSSQFTIVALGSLASWARRPGV